MRASELIDKLTSLIAIHGDCEVGMEVKLNNTSKCPHHDEEAFPELSIFNTHEEFIPFDKDDFKVIEKMACGSRVFTLGYIDTTDTETYDCDNCAHYKLCTHAKGKSFSKIESKK